MITGYKGFNKDLKCRGHQYEIGKKYTTDKAKTCESGFHFCENPLDVFRYYSPAVSRFAKVAGSGMTDKHDEDSKVACTHLQIGMEIGLKDVIEAGMKFVFEKVKWGGKDTPQTHGDSSAAQTHGDYSAASVFGEQSIAVSTGIKGKAKGKKTCWLVLSEWKPDTNGNWVIKSVKSAIVDGKKIKEDVFYTLKNGKFVELGEWA